MTIFFFVVIVIMILSIGPLLTPNLSAGDLNGTEVRSSALLKREKGEAREINKV